MDIIVVAESWSDKELACDLADRVISEKAPNWIGDQLEVYRRWRGIGAETEFTKWTEIKGMSRNEGLRILGHRRGEPGGFDFASARKVIALSLLLQKEGLLGLLIVRDMDRQQKERRRSLLEARADVDSGRLFIVFALPNPMREAWVLNGFVPSSPIETQLHDEEKGMLGFDPCAAAEALVSRHESEAKSPKRVLRSLTQGDREREKQCWQRTPLHVLAGRGMKTGLKEFLDHVEKIIVPLISK